jgi:hypothetical protein
MVVLNFHSEVVGVVEVELVDYHVLKCHTEILLQLIAESLS